MPEVHFVGEIEYCRIDHSIFSNISTSITWAVVTGNSSWSLREGSNSGETQACLQSDEGTSIYNHPLDLQLDTSTVEGWPFIVCEIWDKTFDGNYREFIGCGE